MKILIVEDSEKLRRSLGAGLAGSGYEVDHAANGREGLALACHGRYDLILLDLMLPGIDGFEVLTRLREHDRRTPVLILSARDTIDDRVAGLGVGADDYLVKPFSFRELLARIESIGRRRAESLTDPDIGTGNLAAFHRRIEDALETKRMAPGERFAVLLFDLDQSMPIANGFGPRSRAVLLSAAAERISSVESREAFVARTGPDEIGLIVGGMRDLADVYSVASRVRESLRQPIPIGEYELLPSVSVGIVWARSDYRGPDDVLRDAGAALHRAKTLGRDRCIVFQSGMRDRVVREFLAENDLRRAIRDREFFLEYQPILDLRTGAVTEVEALLRWQHPVRGVVTPNEFMPSLEQSGLIVPVGNWVLKAACRQMARWRAGGVLEEGRVAVNLAAKQLVPGIVEVVRAALDDADLPGDALCLEVTETMMIEASDAVGSILTRLRSLGVRLSLDDFGTGYSSLRYLHELPFDTLKIDRSFVSPPENGSRSTGPILRSIVALARELHLAIIAEGVENDDQLGTIRALDCDQAQGFLFSRPVGAGGVVSRVRQASHSIPSVDNLVGRA